LSTVVRPTFREKISKVRPFSDQNFACRVDGQTLHACRDPADCAPKHSLRPAAQRSWRLPIHSVSNPRLGSALCESIEWLFDIALSTHFVSAEARQQLGSTVLSSRDDANCSTLRNQKLQLGQMPASKSAALRCTRCEKQGFKADEPRWACPLDDKDEERHDRVLHTQMQPTHVLSV
jgi:hypothetical protein